MLLHKIQRKGHVIDERAKEYFGLAFKIAHPPGVTVDADTFDFHVSTSSSRTPRRAGIIIVATKCGPSSGNGNGTSPCSRETSKLDTDTILMSETVRCAPDAA